jgi:hypothetical protein
LELGKFICFILKILGMLQISPYLNCGKDMNLRFKQPNSRFIFSCVQDGLETGNQTMGHGFLLRAQKAETGYQTTRQKWPMTRSRCAMPPISLVQACRNSAQATKRTPREYLLVGRQIMSWSIMPYNSIHN